MFQNGLGFVGLHKTVDPDGAGIVGHIEADHPGVSFFQFLVLHIEHTTLHDHKTHVQIQFRHRGNSPTEGLSVEGIRRSGRAAGGLCRLLCQCRQFLAQGCSHGFHGVKQSLTLQGLCRNDFNGHIHAEALPQRGTHLGNQFLNGLLAVGSQMNGELIALPLPLSSRQRASGHGVPADKQLQQFPFLNAVKLVVRMPGPEGHRAHTIQICQVFSHLLQKTLGQVHR